MDLFNFLLREKTPVIFLVIAFGILLYLPSINIPFINDEISFIKRTEVSTFSELYTLFDKKDYDGDYYRPLPNFISGFITLFFSSQSGTDNPYKVSTYNFYYYRIFNLLLHTVAGVLVFFFCLTILKNQPDKKIISLFAALFFLAFPLQDYAVIWHTDLFDRLMLIFYLAALISFMKNS